MQERVEEREVNGIRLAVRRFEVEGAAALPERRTLLLLHGFLDAGSTWDGVAEPLARAGYEVIAPDLRGFGASARVPAGGYYHFPDYVADVSALVDELAAPWLGVVGHSMGGTVATLFTGTRPERVARLALLEGLGPMSEPPELGVERMRAWLRDLAKVGPPRPVASLDEAATRLGATHPRIDAAVIRSRAERLVRRAPDGTLTWAWDPLHRTRAPTGFNAPVFCSYLRAITCPTLFVSGGPLGFHPPDEEERLAAIASLERFELPEAGHMLHWTAPGPLAARLATFFGAT